MIIHSVKLINYKSIGDYNEAEIIIEPKITAIIGKNESGKSNVLDGLSNIHFTNNNPEAFVNDKRNRNNGSDAEIKYVITLKSTQEEKDKMNIIDDSIIIITKDNYEASGGIVSYYIDNIKFYVDDLIETLGQNPFNMRDQELRKYNSYIAELKNGNNLNIIKIDNAISSIKSWIPRAVKEIQETLISNMNGITEEWSSFIMHFPTVFYRSSEKVLKSQYKLEDVQKELQSPSSYPSSLLSDLVHLIQMSTDDFISAVQAGITGDKATKRSRIKRNIESQINNEFCKFYSADHISLSADFDSNILYFSVQSDDGESMLLSERSNGLRWYLNMFIDAKANNILERNVIYLLDEPGTSLHVNAQRELLELFKDLAGKGNQVVYTTHSPYMLDTENEGIHRIRAVEKDRLGYTYIYKTAYDARINTDSQEDTLTPIISAIGMNLKDTFGPSKDRLNIVTEGVSDFIYLHTFAKLLEFDLSQYSFIPSNGATNCLDICSILHGWGCPYLALFDYDKEGVEKGAEVFRKDFLYELGKQYLFVIDVTQDDIVNKTYLSLPVMIENLVTEEELSRFKTSNNVSDKIGKTLLAKLFCNGVQDGSYHLGVDCINNFKELFEKITSISVPV